MKRLVGIVALGLGLMLVGCGEDGGEVASGDRTAEVSESQNESQSGSSSADGCDEDCVAELKEAAKKYDDCVQDSQDELCKDELKTVLPLVDKVREAAKGTPHEDKIEADFQALLTQLITWSDNECALATGSGAPECVETQASIQPALAQLVSDTPDGGF